MDIIYSLLKNKSALLSFLNDNNLLYDLLDTEQGLEREALRVHKDSGVISRTPHPKVFEPKELHPFIKTDYSEAQLEFVSPVFKNNLELYNFMNLSYDIFSEAIAEDEIIYPYSWFPKITDIDTIEIAKFDETEFGISSTRYREYLTEKYGKDKQLISGIHYNFSLSETFLKKFYTLSKTEITYKRFRTEVYFKIMRNYNRYKFFITYMQGATPFGYDKNGDKISGYSLRNSKYGYKNTEPIDLDYDNVDIFLESVKNAIKNKKIYDEREIYTAIRLKGKNKTSLQEIVEKGVKYVEIRNIDVNPLEKSGISLAELDLLKIFILFCFLYDDCDCDTMNVEGENNLETVALSSSRDIFLEFCDGSFTVDTYINTIFRRIREVFITIPTSLSIVNDFEQNYINNQLLYSKLQKMININNFDEYFVKLGNQYKKEALKTPFRYFGCENMELSTQILMREAIKKGIYVDILDENDNFIKLSKDGHTEYVKQCTKTSKDSYISMLIMENKVVTKKILEEQNIPVPKGKSFNNREDALLYALSLDSKFVIKPNSTNFGIGVFIFEEKARKEDIEQAIDVGFKNDTTVIVEQFIKGIEYRFLIVGDEVAGVLERVPANVVGDGKSTISKLVEEKNKNILRGVGYKTPLEKIKIDTNVEMFLKSKGLDKNYIPQNNEQVFLRKNSNISTGGDSIDHTDNIHAFFKEVAINSSKSVDAKFNGVDMIIEDYTNPNSDYGIIELNFNPAIHIHSFPFKGKNRKVAEKVLTVLGF
ncbi:MAG: bifunctional glutamate--cysteine ligase GshA/glutathione synthetase GshB [Lachnospirales bacterium]